LLRIVLRTILISLLALTLTFHVEYVKTEADTPRIDNLLLTTSDLEAAASRLAQWKNSCGIPSMVLNVTWIYSHYNGVDEPEKIRKCIKDFHSNFQTKYVTIFGDADKVPIRYAYVPDEYDNFTATDLYYADLNGTWDDNGDRLYADQRCDYVDGIPDVYVGRIPVSLVEYADAVVNKIEGYHQQFDISQSWTRRIVLAAGTGNNGIEDTHGTGSTVLNEYIANITKDKEVVKLYESAGNLSTASMGSEIDKGALFVNFVGHGDPGSTPIFSAGWLFYWVVPPIWWNGFGISDVRSTTNGVKLPVVTTCSCSTARFDDADCIGEWFVGHPTGGAIAYFGSTRVAYCNANASAPHGVMGEINRKIYEKFYQGFTKLGQMWGETVTEYVEQYVQDYRKSSMDNAKTVMEFILLGDPTLRIYNGPEILEVPSEYATIQGAVNSAVSGDTIFVRNGTYHENVVINKRLSILGEDRIATVIDSGAITVTASDVIISDLSVRNSSYAGISLFNVNYCNISGNVIDSGHFGILLLNSSYNGLTGNILRNCSHGICLLSRCSNNIISYNSMSENYGCGVWVANYTYNNKVFNNKFTNNGGGILLSGPCCNNTIIGNTLIGNQFGIMLESSPANRIYYDNFINNTRQAIIYSNGSLANLWDNEYPSGGSYWSDYNGTDLFCGPYQNETGSDGIGDRPYVIDANNRDRYPLMNSYPCIHAITVKDIRLDKTVRQGFTTKIQVNIVNQGHFSESFNVTVYANTTIIRAQYIILTSGNSAIASFLWNTTGFAEGNYSIIAYAEPVSGERVTTDNTHVGWVIATVLADLNGDGVVDIVDIAIVAKAYGSRLGDLNWNSIADVAEPYGEIDIMDIATVARDYGKTV